MTRPAKFLAEVNCTASAAMSAWAPMAERYVVSVFLDLRGYTAFCVSAVLADIVLLLACFRRRVELAAERFGGVVEGYAGDGAAVFFISDGKHAAAESAALNFAQMVRDDLGALRRGADTEHGAATMLPVSIGVAAGLAAVGRLHGTAGGGLSVVSRGNNLASRLSVMAAPDEIWVDAAIADEHMTRFANSPEPAQRHGVRGLSNAISVRSLAPNYEASRTVITVCESAGSSPR